MSDIADFDQLLYDVEALLRRDLRLAYRILKRRFDLDDEDIEDIKAELIDARQIAVDETNKVLVLASSLPTNSRAQRRQLTVMFCDVVGSTELSDRLDPEDLREIIRRYQQICARVIDATHGHVAQYLGDGLLVYFGYPIAYEDAAVRAVTCGLEIIADLSDITTEDGEPIKVRIGIDTGTVVIGEIGGGEGVEQLALGDTPNIAARIEAQAAPNELLISAATLRLLHDSFEFESRGATALKGVANPIELFAVQRSRDLRSRHLAMRLGNSTPLAGREREMKRLSDAWETTKQGHHSKYFIRAEAGIGKSRLVQELRELARNDGATPITIVCSPLHSDTALYPFIELIHRVIRVRQDDPVNVRLEALRTVLSTLRFPNEETEDILAALLSLKQEFGDAFEQLDVTQRRTRTFETIIDWIIEVTTRNPVLLVIEDLQAADPSTLDLIDQSWDAFEETPTLMLLVARDEFQSSWRRRADIVDMRLRRLDSGSIGEIIRGVCGGCELPSRLISQIEAKSDGVPLYAEEFTKMVLESDLLHKRDGVYELTGELSELEIPSSLQDSLMARLDRLHDGKQVARWGATIGREFSYEIIKALLPDDVTDNGLKELLDLGVIYKRKRTRQTSFIFKHALIQDAAYASLLRTERREYHAHIARIMLDRFATVVQEHPEIIARHFSLAERYEDAVAHWLAAGNRAAQRASNKESLSHFDKGLELVAHLPAGRARNAFELRLLMARGPALIPIVGNGADVVYDTFARALELSRSLNATEDRFPILFGLRAYHLSSGNLRRAHEISRQLAHLAGESGDPGQQLEAHTALANTYFFRGDFVEVENEARAAMRIYDRRRFRNHAYIFGSDPGVLCLSRLANASWQRGHSDRGRLHLSEMLKLAEDINHQFTLTSALNVAAFIHLWRREPELAHDCADRSFEISRSHEYGFTFAWAGMLRGQARYDMGDHPQGLELLEEGFARTTELRVKLMEAWFRIVLGGTKIRSRQYESAARLLEEASASVAETGTSYALPAVHCLKGELLLREDYAKHSLDEAYAAFVASANFARAHGSRAVEVRAYVGMVRACGENRDNAIAFEMLEESLSYFTPGDDSKDIADALDLVAARV